MSKSINKVIIYFLTILIVLANFSLLLAPKKVKAATQDASVLFRTYNQNDESGEITSSSWEKSNNTIKNTFSYSSPRTNVSGTYEQNYSLDSNNPIVKYLAVYTPTTELGEAQSTTRTEYGIPGLTTDYITGASITYTEQARFDNYKMWSHLEFFEERYVLAVKGEERILLVNRQSPYGDNKLYKLAQGEGSQPLDIYIREINGLSTPLEDLKPLFENINCTATITGTKCKFIDYELASAPEIFIKGEGNRPDLTFKLKHVIGVGGGIFRNSNNFYFVAQNSSFFSGVSIKIGNSGAGGTFVQYNEIQNNDDDKPIGGTVNIDNATWLKDIINRVYNAKAVEGSPNNCGTITKDGETTNPPYTTPGDVPLNCINVETTGENMGWLGAWGVGFNEASFWQPEGGTMENTCGIPFKSLTTKYFIAAALCAILEFMGDIADMIIGGIFKNVFNTYAPNAPGIDKTSLHNLPLFIQKAYAQEDTSDSGKDLTPLDEAFTGKNEEWPWVIDAWKFTLGLANLFLVVVLLFLGVVNILHIQYDTYAIKKMLPLLIIGVILANFSLLIMRMLIDASNILTTSFMGGEKPGTFVHKLITDMTIDETMKGFASGWKTVGGLFLAVIFSFFAIVAFFILGIMFYIRFAAIVLLGIIAPLAFVAMAFPPTQTVFKQWWSWASKMIFMKPIAMFLIYLAYQIKTGTNAIGSITAWIIIVALVYMAILVPWKLGGVVMGMWGGAMGSLFGTKKGGWARKPVAAWAQRKVDVAKGALATRFGNTALGRFIDRGRKFDEMRLEDYKTARETQMNERGKEIKAGTKRFEHTKHEAERAKTTLETQEQVNLATILNGTKAEETKEEEIELINAKGEVERVSAVAEENVRERLGEAQNLREMEVARAKEAVDIAKQERDENIREGNVENLTGVQIEEITGLSAATGENTPVNVKSRYLEQSNRLSIVKDRATKRTLSDVEIIAQRDAKMNNNLRQTMDEFKEAGRGINSTYALDGNTLAAGTTEKVTWTQAREAAEQLRYRATSAEGDERVRLENVAKYFDTQAAAFETANANYDMTMVRDLDNRQAALRLQATTAATPEQRRELEETADRMMNASRIVREKIATAAASGKPAAIGYREYYLTNNLAGRRQKIINPDVADEIHTAVITNPASSLYQDVLADKPVGAGEAKTNQAGIYLTINGRMNELDEAQARGAMIQLGAIHTVMSAARQGETKGLSQINGMMKIMEGAGRDRFKVAAARSAIDAMPPQNRNAMREEAMRQAGTAPGTDWTTGLTAAQQEAALQNLNFEQLNIKGTSPEAVAQRDFVDRFLDRFEEDEGMALTSSPGTRASKSRVVDPRHFTENQ